MRRALVLAVAGLLGLTTAVHAQDAGTVDLGIYGRYTMPDDNLHIDNALGFGVRFGYFVYRNFALEGERSWSFGKISGTEQRADIKPYHVRLAYHRPFNDKWTGIVGAGWSREILDLPQGASWEDDGVSVLFGVLRNMREDMALRLDFVTDIHKSPVNETPTRDLSNTNFGIQIGIVMRSGR